MLCELVTEQSEPFSVGSGATSPIGIIKDEGSEVTGRTTMVGRKENERNNNISPPPPQTMFTVRNTPGSWSTEDEWKQTRARGENKNPKIYIYVYIYIYLYIYEVCIHKKRKENTQNFQNRQSVFLQMCPLLATPSGNININIINYKLKIKVGSFAVQQPCQTSQSGSLRPEAPTSGVQKHRGGAGVWLLHSEK